MSQFRYMNEINSMLTLDSPLTKGPVPRWQRRQGRENTSNTSTNTSLKPGSSSFNTTSSKTPSKQRSASDCRKAKTPSKTPSKSKTPSRTPSKTPNVGDRFIPVRSASNFELGHFKLTHPDNSALESPSKQEMQRVMCENLNGLNLNRHRILSFQKKAPTAPDGFQNPMRVLYTQAKTPASVKSSSRYIPQAPDRILDAPDIIDDYYLNLIDWSDNNVLAAALASFIYVWNAATGKIEQLLELPANDYVSSVAWIQEGDFLAVGRTNGTTELWDANAQKRLRVMAGHSARVGALAWNSFVLTTGSRTGHILHHDVRAREHQVGVLEGHTQEVCGLKWSTDGKYLASGANDNVLNIWPVVTGSGRHSGNTPVHVFTAHQAAVKALAWCPWQPHVLASGGGTADRHIRFWNCNTGACINAVDTRSQVCALLWSTNYKELISGHGFAQNQISIWKYPGMSKVTELTGHTARVLHLAMSPDGNTLLSAGADETLRLWNGFTKTPATKSKEASANAVKVKTSALKQSIR